MSGSLGAEPLDADRNPKPAAQQQPAIAHGRRSSLDQLDEQVGLAHAPGTVSVFEVHQALHGGVPILRVTACQKVGVRCWRFPY